MKPVIPMRFRPICLISAILALTTPASVAQNYVVFDSIHQLQSYIEREKDATLVINFWATWCKPCVEELPIFEELNRMYDDQDLKIILVSLDFKSQLERKFVPFLKSKSLEFGGQMLSLCLQLKSNFVFESELHFFKSMHSSNA